MCIRLGGAAEDESMAQATAACSEGGCAGGGSDGSSSRAEPSGSEMVIEKRTRFSLSHDEGSIGNTSDNLEAVSEAASNHSVASSLDDVEQVCIFYLINVL